MKKSWIVIGVLAGIFLTMGTSCADKPKSLNPNGDSELALLMRAMHEEGMVTKQQLLKGCLLYTSGEVERRHRFRPGPDHGFYYIRASL